MTKEKIQEAIKYATSNKQSIQKSEKAACYYCLKTYNSSEVLEFIEPEGTALCPKCGIDSVLPSNSPYELLPEVLKELHKYWF